MINYVHDVVTDNDGFKPYWINTGGTVVIDKALVNADHETKMQLEKLLKNEELILEIEDNIILSEMLFSATSLWGVLISSGYLTTVANKSLLLPNYSVKLPNYEVKAAFVKELEGN